MKEKVLAVLDHTLYTVIPLGMLLVPIAYLAVVTYR
jgi:hypothetical protein